MPAYTVLYVMMYICYRYNYRFGLHYVDYTTADRKRYVCMLHNIYIIILILYMYILSCLVPLSLVTSTYVSYHTLPYRYPKASAEWYKQYAKTHSIYKIYGNGKVEGVKIKKSTLPYYPDPHALTDDVYILEKHTLVSTDNADSSVLDSASLAGKATIGKTTTSTTSTAASSGSSVYERVKAVLASVLNSWEGGYMYGADAINRFMA